MQNPTIPEYSISIVCYYIAYIILITMYVFTYLLFKDVTCMRLYIKNWNCTFLLRSCKTFRGQFTNHKKLGKRRSFVDQQDKVGLKK